MKTKIYYEVKDNTGWVSSFYRKDIEKTKKAVEIMSKTEYFDDSDYFIVNKVEIIDDKDKLRMYRTRIATYYIKEKQWEL